jgi:hypothetical protein
MKHVFSTYCFLWLSYTHFMSETPQTQGNGAKGKDRRRRTRLLNRRAWKALWILYETDFKQREFGGWKDHFSDKIRNCRKINNPTTHLTTPAHTHKAKISTTTRRHQIHNQSKKSYCTLWLTGKWSFQNISKNRKYQNTIIFTSVCLSHTPQRVWPCLPLSLKHGLHILFTHT